MARLAAAAPSPPPGYDPLPDLLGSLSRGRTLDEAAAGLVSQGYGYSYQDALGLARIASAIARQTDDLLSRTDTLRHEDVERLVATGAGIGRDTIEFTEILQIGNNRDGTPAVVTIRYAIDYRGGLDPVSTSRERQAAIAAARGSSPPWDPFPTEITLFVWALRGL